MSKVTVGLIQMNNSSADSFYFPYSVGLLKAYFQKYSKKSEDFEFLDFLFTRVSVDRAVEYFKRVQIVGFSVYVWNYRLSLAIARKLKEQNPEVLTVFGGPHVPDKAEAFLTSHRFVDIACHQEGEETFLRILENYNTKNWKSIQSVSYIENGQFIHQPRQERIGNISRNPSPYLENTFKSLIRNNTRINLLGLWETNRGCPFTCAYCDWGASVHNRLSKFDMGRLEKEIQWFAENNVEFIFCCDANFGIFKRDLDIVKKVASVKKIYGYPKAFSVQNTKNSTEMSYAVQKVLSEAGLNKGVNLAMQTIDKTTLRNIGRQNMSLETFYELQRKFVKAGVETFTDLILALPGETYASFTSGVSKLIEMGQHHRIQFINLSILPNAAMGSPKYQEKYAFGIVETKIINMHGSANESKEEIYETQKLVVSTKTMPPQDWIKCRVFSWMAALLYFDKLLQIPLTIIHQICCFSYKELIEVFLSKSNQEFPIISEIRDFFFCEARKLQNGGLEFCKSEEWLNLYWPHDEYIFIKLLVQDEIGDFYKEAEALLTEVLKSKGGQKPQCLVEAMTLNQHLIKRPFKKEDKIVHLRYNIWEYYRSILLGEPSTLEHGSFTYIIDRTSTVWENWNDWLREVVWYGNKKGDYLYSLKAFPLKF
jgi:radical SAM superfamily enzyme YgiQ (UPF0313 family)